MDTSEKYIEMCEKAEEIQNIYFSVKHWELLPSFIFDKRMKRIAIDVWTPPKLRDTLHLIEPALSLSIEQNKPLNVKIEEENRLWQESAIWLPRQDQLQEIVLPIIKEEQKFTHAFIKGEHPNRFINSSLIEDFFYFCTAVYSATKLYTYGNFDSIEQLWLAFVMKEKFGKIWDGIDWKLEGE